MEGQRQHLIEHERRHQGDRTGQGTVRDQAVEVGAPALARRNGHKPTLFAAATDRGQELRDDI